MVKPSIAETNGPSLGRATKQVRGAAIREACFADYAQISAVHMRNGLSMRSCEDWIALWKCNPVYKQLQGHWPIGWVLETEDGKIVGSIGNVPLACSFRRRELRAAAPCSWVVDPAYRGYSMLILDRLMRHEDIDVFICTTVSSAS